MTDMQMMQIKLNRKRTEAGTALQASAYQATSR
jgi:hypothetical protein